MWMVNWRYSSTIHNIGTVEASGQLHRPAALPPEKVPAVSGESRNKVGDRFFFRLFPNLKMEAILPSETDFQWTTQYLMQEDRRSDFCRAYNCNRSEKCMKCFLCDIRFRTEKPKNWCNEQLKHSLCVAACRYQTAQMYTKPWLLDAWLGKNVVESKPCKCSSQEGFIELTMWLKSDPSCSVSSSQIE